MTAADGPPHEPALAKPPRRLQLLACGSGEPSLTADHSRLAMKLLLAALGMLFAAATVGHLVIRLRLPQWPPPGSPPLPAGLWLATVVLAGVSGALLAAERATDRDDRAHLRRWSWLAFAGGAGFVLLQVWNWSVLATAVTAHGQNMFTATYWVLTVLHGVHVIGGLVPLALVAVRAGQGRYGAINRQPVVNVCWYWHFLGATWLAIMITLLA